MEKQLKFIKKELKENIKMSKKRIDDLYSEKNQAEKLPNDCLGYVDEDGIKCENPNMKIDLLTGYEHQIGYLECLLNNSINILSILEMNDSEFESFIKRDKEIEEQNKKTLAELKKKIKFNRYEKK
jgi:hypothetical protein